MEKQTENITNDVFENEYCPIDCEGGKCPGCKPEIHISIDPAYLGGDGYVMWKEMD